ncbi:MAG: START domain-containing protein [Thiotrichales bacterium]|nr:START domain-containing protein [Thiotrichales bacterium]
MLLSTPLKTTLLISTLLVLPLASSYSFAWEQQSYINQDTSDSAVKVWTKTVEGSDFKAFRGEVIINAPLNDIVSVIRDTQNVPKWYYKSKLAKQLKRLNDHQSLNYSVTDLPWPVSDRDSVILATVTNGADGSVNIQMTGQPDAYPRQDGLVRVPKLEGFWKLEPQNTQTAHPSVKVTLQVSTEPGGEIPSWLTNAMVVDMPLNSLSNLKKRVESGQGLTK